jgi:cholest-4-en-3-one 26-monooxygenase
MTVSITTSLTELGNLPGVRIDADRPTVDLLDPALYRSNPHQLWTWMRANEPVYRDERNGLWGVTTHHDVMDVERRSNVFVSGAGYRAIWAPDEINMIAQDDPRHRQQRMMVQHHFTRAATSAQRPQFATLITELIDAVIDAGTMEVVDAIAGQLPARLTCRLMGFDETQWRDVKSWSERLMRIDMRERDGSTWDEFVNANMEFGAALGEAVRPRIGCPHNDLISDWVNGTIEGEPLSPAAILHETGLFISGGAETTRTLISHGLRVFCDHPDQWEALAADPSLVPGAVEELLRWVTPLNNFFRRAMSNDHIGTQAVKRGDRVILLYPSANRDETVFTQPFDFDIRRQPNQHLAFGFGTHLCLGANFARTELTELFTQLPQRITNLRALTEPDVEDNIFARAVRSFTLGFDVR